MNISLQSIAQSNIAPTVTPVMPPITHPGIPPAAQPIIKPCLNKNPSPQFFATSHAPQAIEPLQSLVSKA